MTQEEDATGPEALISGVVLGAFPEVVAVGARLRRNWIARAIKPLPDQATLLRMQQVLEETIFAIIENAYSSSVTRDQLIRAKPTYLLVRLDDLHLLVRIEFAANETTVGDAATIAQWGALQRIDREIELDDLQGLPCRFWFPLRAAREERESK